MASSRRLFNLRVWDLALGYFFFYAPYSALIKITTTGLWPGVGDAVSGFRLLPAASLSTAASLILIVSVAGWWKYARRRRVFGLSVPLPGRHVFLAGLGAAVIIAATTLAFTFSGVSIVLALVLMRAGTLVLAPVVDGLFGRRVRWFSWAALALSALALLVALADAGNYEMSRVAALTVVAYLCGYFLRLPFINKLAKTGDEAATRRYFVEEVSVAAAALVVLPAAFALVGRGEIAAEVREGFAGFFAGGVTLPAVIIGALYACLFYFGTLIYLDCRENSFCIPLNRGSSLLAGLCASCALALFFGQRPPSAAQLAGAGLVAAALLLLSPLHHFRRTASKLRGALAHVYRSASNSAGRRTVTPPAAESVRAGQAAASQEQFETLRRLFLFVCSGNTCRSPMAAAISNAEIAARLKVPFESLGAAGVQALSAGVSARAGAPMTPEAEQALRSMGVPVRPHAARNLTAELAHQVEAIFCMTFAHREAVIDMLPSAASKTHCLDPEGDIEDPLGSGAEAHLKCAAHIRRLVRWRLDEARLTPSL